MLKISEELIADDILEGPLYADVTYRDVLPLEEIAFGDEEKKARILFQSLQPEAYARYEASDFWLIKTGSSIFPIRYEVQRGAIWVYDNVGTRPISAICVAPKLKYSNPDTDNILQLYLMLKWNEEYVLRTGNWDAGYVRAWWVLCKKYPLHVLKYYVLRLSRKVLAVLSFCTGGRR